MCCLLREVFKSLPVICNRLPFLNSHIKRASSVDSAPNACGVVKENREVCTIDAYEEFKCYKQPRVVIIGAGAAGIAAAYRLYEKGFTNFIILESLERAGGRIKSCWLGDAVAELGGELIEKHCNINPVYEVAASEDVYTPLAPPATKYPRGLLTSIPREYQNSRTMFNAYWKFKQIVMEVDNLFCYGDRKAHGSIREFMSHRIQQELHGFEEPEQHQAARIMFGLAHMFHARSGDDQAFITADNQGCFLKMPGGEARVPLGYIRVLAPFLRLLPSSAIHYCKNVNMVYWGTSQKCGHRAIVYTTIGEEYPADYVICTVSLGVLNRAKIFCPSIPAPKFDVFNSVKIKQHNKIYLEYCRPFWTWYNSIIDITFRHNEDEIKGKKSSWTDGISSIKVVPFSTHVLCVNVKGIHAKRVEGMSDEQVAMDLTNLLRARIGSKCIPYPAALLRSNWSNHPSFYGAYSHDISADGTAQRILACPVPGPTEPVPPIILFAGEHTAAGGFYGTFDGARISGIREAERIIELTRLLKGPPLPSVRSFAKTIE